MFKYCTILIPSKYVESTYNTALAQEKNALKSFFLFFKTIVKFEGFQKTFLNFNFAQFLIQTSRSVYKNSGLNKVTDQYPLVVNGMTNGVFRR